MFHYHSAAAAGTGAPSTSGIYGARRTAFRGAAGGLGRLVDATGRIDAEARQNRLHGGLPWLDEWSRRLLAARGDEARLRRPVCEGLGKVLAAGLVALTALGGDRR